MQYVFHRGKTDDSSKSDNYLNGVIGYMAQLTEFLNVISHHWEDTIGTLIRILLIILCAYFGNKMIDRLISRAVAGSEDRLRANPRLATLTSLLQSVVMYIVYFIAAVMILGELNVKTSSILASAGIFGVAVGLGAQNLIKDVISGFFIILEDHYAVGDYVKLGELSGFVTELGLRATRLTDWDGEVHIIPNGQIMKVTNHSRSSRQATVDVIVPYQYESAAVFKALNGVTEKIASEFDYIREGPRVLGVTELKENHMVIRIEAMTEPMKQWELEREIRARIRASFEAEGLRPS